MFKYKFELLGVWFSEMFSDDDGFEMERRMRYYVVRGMRERENKINKI